MNKIFQFGLIAILTGALGGCCSTAPVNCGSTSDTFRVTMGSGLHGKDVAHWQCFLKARGFSQTEPNGTFDQQTAEATSQFQRSSCYGGTQNIKITGTVTVATYLKAVSAGMPKYILKKIPTSMPHLMLGGGEGGKMMRGAVGTRTIGTGELFWCPMKPVCQDTPGDLEVSAWQNILMCLGYDINVTGIFDGPTQTLTQTFQSMAGLIGKTGVNAGWVDYGYTYPTAVEDCPCTVDLIPKKGTKGCNSAAGGS